MIELKLETFEKSKIELGDILHDGGNTFLVINKYSNKYVDDLYSISVLDLKTYSLNALTQEDAETSYKLIKKAILSTDYTI